MQRKSKLGPLEYTLAGLFAATIVVVLLQVVSRYLLDNSLTWTEELSRYLFAWIIFLGAALGVRDQSHIKIDFFVAHFPKPLQRVVDSVNVVLIAIFLVTAVIFGFQWVGETADTRSPALSLPVNWVLYGALPCGALAGVLYLLMAGWRRIRDRHQEERS
ncbi:TRAP transporter small permease [Pirellulales bacterium]|nr:TRAP transporter small permease [Pirellulales bacterium]